MGPPYRLLQPLFIIQSSSLSSFLSPNRPASEFNGKASKLLRDNDNALFMEQIVHISDSLERFLSITEQNIWSMFLPATVRCCDPRRHIQKR
jgi:hypothetical protein